MSDFEGHDLPLDAPTAKAEPLLAGMSSSFQNLLMQLRKACNHPYLFAPPHYSNASRSVDGGNEKERLFRDGLVRSSGKMVVLLQLLERLVSDGHRTLVFSQMTRILDLIEDAIEVRNDSAPAKQKKIRCCRIDGTTGQAERQSQVQAASSPLLA